eukprot:TRINITY_DN67932_c0_g1_i1.p1 TRINITY_DN67932_c0_g1~~TRINITY_DN67932_c0_g1_i1.p1  ORF type:complete len:288 (+),score=29.86 TRINITY_DN67932_c0_g1_i1:28-864(+)
MRQTTLFGGSPATASVGQSTTKIARTRTAVTQKLFLDIGQKNTGTKQCAKCGMVFTCNSTEDVQEHLAFCGTHDRIRVPRCKTERVISKNADGSLVICVTTSDHPTQLRLVSGLKADLDAVQGYSAMPSWSLSGSVKSFLLISEKRHLLGFLIADQGLTEAVEMPVVNRLRPSAGPECTEKSVAEPVKTEDYRGPRPCGRAVCVVQRLWVHPILVRVNDDAAAALLVDSARQNLIYGFQVPKEGVAFIAPTLDTQEFARRYDPVGICRVVLPEAAPAS